VETIYTGGGDQDVEVYAQDHQGRIVAPSSAMAKIVDLLVSEDAPDSERIVADTTAAVIDSVSTTTTAYAGIRAADLTLIPVVSAAGIVAGRTYVLASGASSQAVLVDRVDGTDVYSRDPLRAAFSAGATLVGARVSSTFPASRADDPAQLDRRAIFGVDWAFAGVLGPTRVRTLATIERRRRLARATVEDVLAIDEQVGRATHTRTALEAKIAQADREITAYQLHRGSVPAEQVDGELGRLAVAYRALELSYRVLGTEHVDRANWARDEARRWRKMLLDGHQASDAIETQRSVDRRRPTRRPLGVSVIRGPE
jgi:hypothetical protein